MITSLDACHIPPTHPNQLAPPCEWTSFMPTYVQLQFRTAFSLSCCGNRIGLRRCTSDSGWESDHLWYSFHWTVRDPFKQTNRQGTSRNLSESRHTPVTSDKVDIPNNSFSHFSLAHTGNTPALKWLTPNVDLPVPWQRVIASSGKISSRGPGTDGAQRQRDALEAEGVEVTDGRGGDMKVDLRTYGWFPNALGGQEGDGRDAGE